MTAVVLERCAIVHMPFIGLPMSLLFVQELSHLFFDESIVGIVGAASSYM